MLGPYRREVPTGRREATRRRFLGAVATSATVALAGCALDSPGSDSGGQEEDDQTDTSSDADQRDDDESDAQNADTDDDENDDDTDEEPQVPETFDVDRETLREYCHDFVQLLVDEEYEAAARWFPAALRVTPAGTERVWEQAGGTDSQFQEVDTVAYVGNNLNNDVFTARVAFESGEAEVTLSYNEGGLLQAVGQEIPEWTPPAYTDPDAIVEEELSLSTPIDCELGATITLPAEGESVPGVVLVHGNGPQDRDGTVGPNRPFKEMAWGLANRGIAVLRYDKRTYVCEADHADATIDDIVTVDALTAIERLREHERVADDEIVVSGSSFGGLLAPRIAERDGTLAGAVMLAAGPADSFADTIVRQQEHQLEQQGVPEAQREQTLERARAEADQIRELDIEDDEVVRFGGREYYRSLQEYDHLATARRLEIPQLFMQGGMDWQITEDDDFSVWQDALDDEPNVSFEFYEELNHLFQKSDGTLLPAEYARPETPVEETVIEEMAAFVEEATTQRQPALTSQPAIAVKQ